MNNKQLGNRNQKLKNYTCPICTNKYYGPHCNHITEDLLEYLEDRTSKEYELEHEVHRLRKLTTPIYFNISN